MKNGRNSEVYQNCLPLKFDSFQILRHFITEVVLGYVFWSLMFGLPPMIWFYPLNELDFTGYEAFLAVMLIPVICVPKVFSVLQTYPAISLLRLIALGSLASFHAPSTFSRLVILSIGTPAVLVVYMTTLWSSLPFQRIITFWGNVLGFYLLLAGRIWYVSAVPTWADFKSNSIIIAIGSLATLDRILTGFDKNALYYKKKNSDATHWLCNGLGYGSFLYLIYLVLGEVSVMSRWVVTGYPNPGPQPNPWGALVFACIAWGIALSFHNHKFLKSPVWWLLGLGGILCLYYLPTYLGFLGGLVLATFLMSIWPHFTSRIIQDPPHKVMTVAMLTCMSEILFSIWTIAYNFVPGGTYTREHTDWLLYFVCAAIFLGFFIGKKESDGSELLFSGHEYFKNLKAKLVLILLLSVGLSGFIYRSNYWNNDEFSSKPETKEFSSLIWTYHFGYDNNGWPSLERSAQLLNDTGADVITLLESDASKPFLGNQDLAMWLGERLKMHVDFGPSTRDHTWGTLLLSRYPIIKSQHHLLPSPHGELAPAISATVNITGHLIDFVVTHMGNDRDSLDRKLQAMYLSELTRASPNPVIFMGYVTSAPYNRDYKQLIQHGRMKDIDATDSVRWCEYIMYRGLIRLGYSRISHGGLSDTELQLAKFKIPDSEDFKDNDRYVIDEKDIPTNQLFNKRFGVYKTGHHWGSDHHFHMGTPKYFLPENSGDKKKSKS